MSTTENWISCKNCNGLGKKKQSISKSKRLGFENAFAQFQENKNKNTAPVKPKNTIKTCTSCSGTGLLPSTKIPCVNTKKYPHVAIIGAGIGGIALALACLQRNIPFTLFERDASFNDRSQGYGLTLQQASKELKKFGITTLKNGIVSTLHLAHTTNGDVIGNWGLRSLNLKNAIQNKNKNKQTNIHISRQSLRLAFLNQLGGNDKVFWSHKLTDYFIDDKITLTFDVNGVKKKIKTDLLVGADGIRSSVRKVVMDEAQNPLRYLGCIVVLGICKLSDLNDFNHPLLDQETVFQTANGTERMYMMPFDKDSIMWQFSFPILENDAINLSKKGTEALKKEVLKKTQWHAPIPQIIATTKNNAITGYPVYDRDLLNPDLLNNAGAVTLLGDAAHPMSPFKGQGANQALLDALLLAQKITTAYSDENKEVNLRKDVLSDFEKEMIDRSNVKVQKSAEAAAFLHSDIVLQKGNVTFSHKWQTK